MADSITVSFTETDSINDTNLRIVQVDWVDTPDLALNTAYDGIDQLLAGWYCFMAETIPGAGGAAPDDQYDIVLTNSVGTDIFGGELANRSNTSNEVAVPKIDAAYGPFPIKHNDSLTFTLTNNTNASGTGTIYFYFARY